MIYLIFAVSIVSSFALPSYEAEGLSDPLEFANLISDLNFDGFGLSDSPKPCCFPAQWQGNVKTVMGLNGGRPRLFGEENDSNKMGKGFVSAHTLQLYVDEKNRKVAGQSICPVTKDVVFSFILTFNANKGAILNVFNATAQKCRTYSLEKAVFRDQCIPKDARFIGSMNIGAAVGGLAVNSYTFNVENKKSTFYGNALVTSDTCLPVISQALGKIGCRFSGLLNLNIDLGEEDEEESPKQGRPTGLNFVASSFFYDLQASISDPSVFTPPSYCPEQKLLYKKVSPAMDHISNFIELYK